MWIHQVLGLFHSSNLPPPGPQADQHHSRLRSVHLGLDASTSAKARKPRGRRFESPETTTQRDPFKSWERFTTRPTRPISPPIAPPIAPAIGSRSRQAPPSTGPQELRQFFTPSAPVVSRLKAKDLPPMRLSDPFFATFVESS